MILVFQDYARSLFPWLTVTGNVLFPLKRRKDITQAEKEKLSNEAIKAVGLDRFPKHFSVASFSGGMQQRGHSQLRAADRVPSRRSCCASTSPSPRSTR